MTADLSFDLPRPLAAGDRFEVVGGLYTEGSHGLSFRSRSLAGRVEVLRWDDGRATLQVDVTARDPDRGTGERQLAGALDLAVVTTEPDGRRARTQRRSRRVGSSCRARTATSIFGAWMGTVHSGWA